MYKFFMALRYLRAHRIIYFSVAGVAIGIMTIVVVTSIMGGFRRDMRARIRGMQAHIIVQSAETTAWLPNYEPLVAEISKVPGVKGCSPRIEYQAWLGYRGRRTEVTVVGIDPDRERKVSELAEYFSKGGKATFDFNYDTGDQPKHPGMVLGTELFQVVGPREVSLLTARDAGTFPMLCHMTFEPVGRFSSRMAEYDSRTVVTHLFDAQDLLKVSKPMSANLLAISVDDFDANGLDVMVAVRDALHRFQTKQGVVCSGFGHTRGYCGKYRVLNWMQIKANLLAAVEQERAIMIIVMFFIVLVAGFNISSIYTLVVRAKARDIGILRALGATEGGVTSIFLASGGICGIIGSIFGVAMGLLIARNINGIEGFLRISSREMNLQEPWALAVSTAALAVAAVAVIMNWWIFYRPRRPHPWIRMGLALAAIVGSFWLASSWLPTYELRRWYDPKLDPSLRWIVPACAGLVWLFLAGGWRIFDRWRIHPAWIFFGLAWSILLGAVLLAVVTPLAVGVGVLVSRPGPRWSGLELFPRDIYFLEEIPVFVDKGGIAVIVALTLVACVVFSIYPALRAAACNPIESIRDE